MRIKRNPDKYKCANQGGSLLVSLESLSEKAQSEFRESNSPQEDSNDEQNSPPWYVATEFLSYKIRYGAKLDEGFKKMDAIKYFKENGGGKSLAEELGRKFNINIRRFYDMVKLYDGAMSWNERICKLTDENYGYIVAMALAGKPRSDMGQIKAMDEETMVLIENRWYNKDFKVNRCTVAFLYDDLVPILQEKGKSIPTYETVRKYVNELPESEAHYQAYGKRSWKANHMMKKLRDTGDMRVLDLVQGDVHTLDIWVSVERANGKIDIIRPCLIGWLDIKSRCLVGWMICESPNAAMISESLLNMIYAKKNEALPFGIPQCILIDNGKEFTSEMQTGRKRKDRKVVFEFDEMKKGFFQAVGIERTLHSKPYEPWSKAQVERFFGSVCQRFSKKYKTYTGTLSGAKTSGKVNKSSKYLEQHALPLEQVAAEFEEWVVNWYHKHEHSGLRKQGEKDPAPIKVWQNAEHYVGAPLPYDIAVEMIVESREMYVRTHGIGITYKGVKYYYENPELAMYVNEKVMIKTNPNDISRLHVYKLDGTKICVAENYPLMTFGVATSKNAVEEHSHNQKRQQSNLKDNLAWFQMPYEERQTYGSAENFNMALAGKRKVSPELKGVDGKVAALPTGSKAKADRKFVKDQAAEQAEKKRPETPDYIREAARPAIERIMKQQEQLKLAK
jgi:putative transposase